MNKKFLFILFVVFTALYSLILYVTYNNTQSKIAYSIYHHMNKLQINYEVFMTTQTENADIIYTTTINTKGVKSILERAWLTQDENIKNQLREELKVLLSDRYKNFKEQGLLQYHFIFPDNTTFLRMHKPNKYGDDLSKVRLDVVRVNKTKNIVRGFSQGRTAHAFRNVYSVFNDKNEHIGTLEISYPSELLQKKLNDISEIQSQFLVNKDIFDSKMWKRNDRVLKYEPSIIHKDYLLNIYETANQRHHVQNIEERIALLHDEIEKKFEKNRMFSLVSGDSKSDYTVLSFYPISQNVTGEISAWLVAYNKAPFILSAIHDSTFVRIISFIILGLLLFFIYLITKQKNTLGKLLHSYDNNVIFSTTDLSGNITHVSKAFCEISGYTEEELIGQPHNIVRHQDMPKSAFKDMWTTIKSGKTWRGEVKNITKNGGYYWVDAEIEPIYNDAKKAVGYSALRHDITDKKEIEEIQKEIIFTMGSIGESRSKETGNHVRRVAEYSKVLALAYGLDKDEAEMLRQASPMHDIGKIGIPDSILTKPAKLDAEEWKVMKTHAELGYSMLNTSSRPLLQIAAVVAYEHHEKWDGTGYPRGLKGKEINLYGRITAIADVYDALGSDRVYKSAWKDEKIYKLFEDESGKQFDPKLIQIFFENVDELLKIREKFQDI